MDDTHLFKQSRHSNVKKKQLILHGFKCSRLKGKITLNHLVKDMSQGAKILFCIRSGLSVPTTSCIPSNEPASIQ